MTARPALGLLLAPVLLSILSGCVTRMPLPESYDGPDPLPQHLADRFAYRGTALEPETKELRERRHFTLNEVTLPGDGPTAREITFEYYEAAGDEIAPVVVVLPIVNGNMIVSRYFARYFASQGWSALVLDHEEDPLDAMLDDPEGVIRSTVFDYRRVLDWVDQQPELGDVGLFGLSFGGMAAVVLSALDERVEAVVVAMAGGDLPHVVMNTSYRRVARRVHQELRETGMTRERLEERLDHLIASDPLAFAPYADAEEIMLVMTRTDMIMPFEAQQQLRDELGMPETIFLPTGHRTSVFYFPLLRNTAYDFFERQFSALH